MTLALEAPPVTMQTGPTKKKRPKLYIYHLLIGLHFEADYEKEPDPRSGIYPDKGWRGPCEIMSSHPDLHIKWPNKFAVPMAWSGSNAAPIPEGSLLFDPAAESLENFVARASRQIAEKAGNPNAAALPQPVPPSVADNPQTGKTPTPVQGVSLPAHARNLPNFDSMTIKELKEFADAEEITLPTGGNGGNINAVRAAIKQAMSGKGTV